MTRESKKWEIVEVKNLIWKKLCRSKNGKVDFAPLLFDVKKGTPSSPTFTKTVDLMKRQGYVTDDRPNYGHYWVELKRNGQKKCKARSTGLKSKRTSG
ncbi:MAG: hypothetical protein ABEJ25_04250 [Candidatus Bipolaricaulia bacterium]